MVDSILSGSRFEVADDKKYKESPVYSPYRGRVYITRRLDYALIYAIGGDYSGSTWNDAGYKDLLNPMGGILEIEVKNERLLWPDEDVVGKTISLGYGQEKFDPDRYGGWRYGGWADDPFEEADEELYKILKPQLTLEMVNYLDDEDVSMFDHFETWIVMGKMMIEHLRKNDPEMLNRIALKSEHVSTPPDNIMVKRAWKIDNVKYLHLLHKDAENLFEYARPVRITTPITAHGRCKQGWYNEPYRHALASRGVRTR